MIQLKIKLLLKQNKTFTDKNLTILGYGISVLSICLIFREIISYNKLHALNDPICQLVDFFKYKEDVIILFHLWIMLFGIGIGLTKRNFLAWGIIQSFIFLGIYHLGIWLYYDYSNTLLVVNIISISLTGLIMKYFYSKRVKNYFNVSRIMTPIYYLIAFLLVLGYDVISKLDSEIVNLIDNWYQF